MPNTDSVESEAPNSEKDEIHLDFRNWEFIVRGKKLPFFEIFVAMVVLAATFVASIWVMNLPQFTESQMLLGFLVVVGVILLGFFLVTYLLISLFKKEKQKTFD